MDTTNQLFPVSRYLDCGELNFYYPYGITPAEDFLENVHPNLVKEPDILVLGCGDIRSCFYTLWKHFTANSHSNTVPSFSGVHFVLNDRSAAVLARNIIFLHLCMQKPSNIHGADFSQWLCAMWAIWFSKNLHPNHEKVLNSALRELLHHSIDTKSWASKENLLNSLVQFSSECTLSKIHDVWKMWLTHRLNKESFHKQRSRLLFSTSENTDIENLIGMAVCIGLSSEEKKKMGSEISSCSSGNSFAEYVVCTGQVFPVMTFVANVTMFERTDDKYIMDSLLPFRCFHHAFQFSSSRLKTSCTETRVLDQLIVADERFQEYPLLANSVQQFALWLYNMSILTPSTGASPSIKFTFHCSDAIEFCNELQNSMYESKLKADRFDVIYTSNLLDPVHPPNVVFFSMPLLKADGYLFTTTMKYKTLARTTHEYIANSFGADSKMLPILYGIRCINHEGDDCRDRVSIRPVPVETNAVCPTFTPYYAKVLVWEKVPTMIINDIPPDSNLWHTLYSSIGNILSVPFDNLNSSSSQTAVKMLQTFQENVNADDSDGKFWDPFCFKLNCNSNYKHLLQALQTHSILSGLHLHLLVTDKTCPLCNKIPMSEYFGQINVSVPPLTQLQVANLYARIYKSKEQKQEYSTFDCLASQNDSGSLNLSFVAPIHLCGSGQYVNIVSFCENHAHNILTEGPLQSFLSSKVRYSFSKSKIHRKPEVLSTTLGCLNSHHGNGDTFESIIALSEDSYNTYSKSKKICPERVSASKIIISCGVHKFELSYPHPINFSTLSIKISRLAKTLTIVATRRSHKFHDEEAPLFLVYPDCKVTLPKLYINEIAVGCLMGMQFTDFEASQLRSQTSRLPVIDLKDLINIMMQEKETYFTFMNPLKTVCVMVMVINRVFDYQLKAPAIDLMYSITTEVPMMKKWMKFISSDSVIPIMGSTIELMGKAFLYFSRRTISSSLVPLQLTVKKKIGGCFKRAVVYPLYGDPDHSVQGQKESFIEVKSNPLHSEFAMKVEKHSCSLCGRMEIDLFTCEKCLAVQFCGKCKKENLNKHKVSCNEKKSETVKPLDSVIDSTSPQPVNMCSYCSSQSCRLMKCSKCHSVQYCSQECQKKHWKEHKTHCHYTPNIDSEPKYDEATSDSQTKSKKELSTQVLNSCALCDQTVQTLEVCSICLAVKYCSKECQQKHLVVHEMVCKPQTEVLNETSTCSYCSKVSSDPKKCTLCHPAQYCDKEYQTKHWKLKAHKIECHSENVSSSCTLQTSTSKSSIVELEQEVEKCSFCSRQAKDLKKCTRCRSAMYCNKICQQKHWTSHKTYCKSLSSL